MLKGNLSIYRRPQLIALLFVALLLALLFQKTFTFLYANWQREEYSYGFLIPPISAYLLWTRRALLERLSFTGSWVGFGIVLVGLGLLFVSLLATLAGVDAYALVVVIAGFALAVMGWKAFRIALVPIALLFLMDPLPTFWYNNLSSELQLISSQLGVAIMRLLGVSVFLQGNVIDLGSYQLQVAEACSGLRYLFPLMSLGAVVAYLFRGKLWTRWCVFLSALPITVLMNGLRVGMIGALVDRYGSAQAEGLLHQFEGWALFMACIAVLLGECWLLLRVSGDPRPLRQALAVDARAPGVTLANNRRVSGVPSGPAIAAAALICLAVYPAIALPQRADIQPNRSDFSQFPLQFDGWNGQRQRLEQVYLDELRLDDYILGDFHRAKAPGGAGGAVLTAAPVNLYVAYYASQRMYQAVHSPRSCLPGGGWRIEQFGQRLVPGVAGSTGSLRVNRALIQEGTQRQLVYYWFQERGRDLTNEYLVKWYLVWDALVRNRTDGALVRLITPLREGEDPSQGDARLRRFSVAALPTLHPYLPD